MGTPTSHTYRAQVVGGRIDYVYPEVSTTAAALTVVVVAARATALRGCLELKAVDNLYCRRRLQVYNSSGDQDREDLARAPVYLHSGGMPPVLAGEVVQGHVKQVHIAVGEVASYAAGRRLEHHAEPWDHDLSAVAEQKPKKVAVERNC